MKLKVILCLVLALLISAVLMGKNYKDGELLLQIKKIADNEKLVSQLKADFSNIGLKESRQISRSMNIWLFEFKPGIFPDEEVLSLIKKHSLIYEAQFNHKMEMRETIPDDEMFETQWCHKNTGQSGGTVDADIDTPDAWDISTGGTTALGDEIVIAILDDGFYLDHEDLSFWKNEAEIPDNDIDDDENGYVDDYDGWSAYTHSGNITSMSHGTHVSGIAGAIGNNGIGVAGVNWNVKILPIQASSVYEDVAVEGYTYALDQRRRYDQTDGAEGAFIVSTNASFGVNNGDPEDYPLWSAIYDSLGAVGILSAGATANAHVNVDVMGDIPTACPSDFLISVTNTDRNDAKASSAGYGATTIDLGAPGQSVLSTVPGNSYQTKNGCSMSSPQVAGAVALMFAAASETFMQDYRENPAEKALEIKQYILDGTDPIPALEGITVTGGRLNVFNSIMLMRDEIDVSGTISEDTIWDTDIVNVVGDVTVAPGVVLTIEPGTTVNMTGEYRITAEGYIYAVGTEVDSIIFTSNGDMWDKIRLEDETNASSFSYCRFSYAEYGLSSINSPMHVEYCTFTDMFDRAINIHGIGEANPATILIENSKIMNCQRHGIFIVENSNTTISGCEITCCALDNSPRGAIQLSNQTQGNSNDPVITNNHIHHNVWQGITAFDITGEGGIAPDVTNNIIEYNLTGIYLIQANGNYLNNSISNNFVAGNPNSGAGVMVSGASCAPIFMDNEITGNFTGFYLVNDAVPNLGDMTNDYPGDDGRNLIYDNIDMSENINSVYMDASATLDIMAENNYWGTEDSLEIAATIHDGNDTPGTGIVDFDPIFISSVIEISGPIDASATWDYDSVKVVGDVVISEDASINILPGTNVVFADTFSLTVEGTLFASGVENDSILFTCADTSSGWKGVRIFHDEGSTASSSFSYCIFEYYKETAVADNITGALYAEHCSDLLIDNCRFSNNQGPGCPGVNFQDCISEISSSHFINNSTTGFGGAVRIGQGRAAIEGNSIYGNQAMQGGGIYANGSMISIENNNISGNSALGSTIAAGGGIYVYQCTTMVANNLITNNESNQGGGIHLEIGMAMVRHNIISSNSAHGQSGAGGGICAILDCQAAIINNLIAGNDAVDGAGITTGQIDGIIVNNTIVMNMADYEGGGAFFGGSSELQVYNNIFWANRGDMLGNQVAMQYSEADYYHNCFEDGTDSIYVDANSSVEFTGNIESDPAFENAQEGDFALTSMSYCINAGYADTTGLYLQTTDLLGNPRIYDGEPANDYIDIGAYEYQGECSVYEDFALSAFSDMGSKLLSSYPNPFNPVTEIRFVMDKPGQAEIKVFNIKGQLVNSLINREIEPGFHSIVWDGKDNSGDSVASGVYFYQLQIDGRQIDMKKFTLFK